MKSDEYTKAEKANEESLKLGYDLFKHLTTLSTGILLILITFLERLFTNPSAKILVSISFCCLVIVVLLSLVLMFLVSAGVGELGDIPDKEQRINRWFFVSTIVFFALGISSFVIFALINFNN